MRGVRDQRDGAVVRPRDRQRVLVERSHRAGDGTESTGHAPPPELRLYGAFAFALSVAPGDAPFNLYVLHQPGWKPTYANANLDTIHIGAADRAEYLIER